MTVTDDQGGATTQVISVTLVNTNDAPIITNDSASTNEDITINNINVLANDSDVDGDLLTVTNASAGNGSVTINGDGTLNYTPDANFNGSDIITYQINDGNAGTASGTLTLFVTAINDIPVANSDITTTDEDITLNNINVLANDTDVDGDTLRVTGAAADNGLVFANPDGSLNYTPDVNFNGNDTIFYDVTDDNGATVTGILNIFVISVNDAPVAVNDSISIDEDIPLSNIDVLGNDTDIEGSQLTVSSATAIHGIVTINPDGTLSYTPDSDFYGNDTLSYSIHDGQGGNASDTGSVMITVNPVNDAVYVDMIVTNEDSSGTINVLSNYTFAPGAILSSVTPSSNGSDTFLSDGTVTYVPNTNFIGSDSFSYTVITVAGDTETSTVNISVIPVTENTVIDNVTNTPATQETITSPTNAVTPQENNEDGFYTDTINQLDAEAEQGISNLQDLIQSLVDGEVNTDTERSDIDDEDNQASKNSAYFNNSQLTKAQGLAGLQALKDQLSNQANLSIYINSEDEFDEQEEQQLFRQINELHQQMAGDESQDEAKTVIEAQIVLGSSISLTAGFVSWALRGGSLLASLMSAVPVLKRFDPLPILKSRSDTDKLTEHDDEEEIESTQGEQTIEVDRFLKHINDNGKGT